MGVPPYSCFCQCTPPAAHKRSGKVPPQPLPFIRAQQISFGTENMALVPRRSFTLFFFFVAIFILFFECASAQNVLLPPRVQVEGIAHAAGTLFFAADFRTGAIFLVDMATGFASTVVPPAFDRFAAGIASRNGSLFVSGGGMVGEFGRPPRMFVYDIISGGTIAACDAPRGALVNDVTADESFAYYTDSALGNLYILRLEALPKCQFDTVDLPSDTFPAEPGIFSANGIVRFASGLIVANSNTDSLFFVDLSTKSVQQLLPPNTVVGADGLEIYNDKGGATATLFVVQNSVNLLSIWRLRQSGSTVSARFIRNITSTEFDTPTTAALGGGRLVVTNPKFTTFSLIEDLPDDAKFSLIGFRIQKRAIRRHS